MRYADAGYPDAEEAVRNSGKLEWISDPTGTPRSRLEPST